MKVFCVDSVGERPVVYLKPDNTLNLKRLPFFLPDFSNDIEACLRVAVRIDRIAKCVEKRFAARYYSEVGLAVEFVAADVLQKAQKEGLPWTFGTSFDESLVISDTVEKNKIMGQMPELWLNNVPLFGDIVSADVIDEALSAVSQTIKLKTGDWLMLSCDVQSRPLAIGDELLATLGAEVSQSVRVK